MPLILLLVLFCNAAFPADPTAVVAVAQTSDGFVVDATIDVLVPQSIAWGVLTDFDHMTSILGTLRSSKVIRREGSTWIVRQEGVARYGLLAFSFESEREVRMEPMKRILAKSLAGTLKRLESETKVIPQAQGVQIKYHAEIVPDSALARMFGASFVSHEVEEQFLAMANEMLRRQFRPNPSGVIPR